MHGARWPSSLLLDVMAVAEAMFDAYIACTAALTCEERAGESADASSVYPAAPCARSAAVNEHKAARADAGTNERSASAVPSVALTIVGMGARRLVSVRPGFRRRHYR